MTIQQAGRPHGKHNRDLHRRIPPASTLEHGASKQKKCRTLAALHGKALRLACWRMASVTVTPQGFESSELVRRASTPRFPW